MFIVVVVEVRFFPSDVLPTRTNLFSQSLDHTIGGYVPVDWEDEYVHTAAISGKAAAYQIMNGNQNAYDLCIQFDGIDC